MAFSNPFWHPGSQMWCKKIGMKHTKTGTRIQAPFYWPGEHSPTAPAEVIHAAVEKQREWDSIKNEWPTLKPLLEQVDPDTDWSGPTWFDRALLQMPLADAEELKEARSADAKQLVSAAVGQLKGIEAWGKNQSSILNELRAAGFLQGLPVATRKPTILEAMNEFFASNRERIKQKVGNAIKTNTHNTTRNNVLIALGMTTGETPMQATRIIDLDRPLLSLSKNDLQAVGNHWFCLPGGVKRRTAKNYLDGLKQFLRWCQKQEEFGFRVPEADLTIKKAGHRVVTETDLKMLKKILKDAELRVKIYAALAYVCGFTQADISQLSCDEVHQVAGSWYITGYRAKEDSEKKQASKILVTHWLPPMLAEAMMKMKAKPNDLNLFFLNRYQLPLVQHKLEGGRNDAISGDWEKLPTPKPQFTQLRKWGWNDIQMYGKDRTCVGVTLSRRWAGQVGGGVDDAYEFKQYIPVAKAQQAWWEKVKNVFQLEA